MTLSVEIKVDIEFPNCLLLNSLSFCKNYLSHVFVSVPQNACRKYYRIIEVMACLKYNIINMHLCVSVCTRVCVIAHAQVCIILILYTIILWTSFLILDVLFVLSMFRVS